MSTSALPFRGDLKGTPMPNGDVSFADTNPQQSLSQDSIPPPGQLLTGKQEHYLKRELISRQVNGEIQELNSPTALQRFGAPFRSEYGEVSPMDSELPILRYIFVNHVRNFPFLNQAQEKEFWQDKLQVFLESFSSKYISSSEDRLEETKRRKLAKKCEKLVELMMVSGIPTASGYEERIRFAELEVVDAGPNEQGLVVNIPEGNYINGWDVNVAGVRTTSIKRTVRYHQHAEFLIRVKRPDQPEIYIGRRYGEFTRLHKRLRTEMPGKVLPPLPRKNKSATAALIGGGGRADDDASSVSSVSTQASLDDASSSRNMLPMHRRLKSGNALSPNAGTNSPKGRASPRLSLSRDRSPSPLPIKLHREDQRVSLRAFLRTILQNPQIAESRSVADFLTLQPVKLNEEELDDIDRRKEMDARRVEEQRQFYDIARQRAAELDTYMEKFRRDIVESNGLTKLFAEIRNKEKLEDLSPEYQKFAEWLRIEVAATIYHLFLAEDNSPELFAQAKRIHSLVPYTVLKNVIRIANPAAVMSGVLDLFLAQPFGTRSLLQRIFAQTLGDGIRQFQKSIDDLITKIGDPVLTNKLKSFVDSDEDTKFILRNEAEDEQVDVVVAILRSEAFQPDLTPPQIQRVFNAYVAWNSAVENDDEELKQGAEMFSHLKQLLKLLTRQRDKAMMATMIEEPTTLQLFRDLFTIFYEPLIRVYKSANVYSSITDFAQFADDAIKTVEIAQRQDVSADPNQTVQSFIDLCARHEHNLYKFIHEVHIHDNGLFTALMGWIENILEFLRKGPKGGKLDMNAIFQGALDVGTIDRENATNEINALIQWQEDRKKWHSDKTRQKMAAEGTGGTLEGLSGMASFKSSDFGLHETDLMDLTISDEEDDADSDEEEAADDLDPISAERRRRRKAQDRLRRSAGEPVKPEVEELLKLREAFLSMLRAVLSE
ncbi:succinate dehydrogenase (ubiquinone) flavoprotein subunit [Exophiala aquamarina CBS 119918]|uniref:Succinate dehydrogenase (Ubiquinone) flavoprotein subunit n=1 Tax=Exophiala aquamarina CBS 119918 TaxID=1182545 RepID=A0A072PUI5_9EURO|nr:succinate dehydrogenase (ubiquinone) flavoprotein subunit [Exophiala aquamarina CBS 119918]KEF63402.1 succinate dehydrogenase (ubiquinone) flavoprotein subunit [Exophiala aquamarina CBS 119918]